MQNPDPRRCISNWWRDVRGLLLFLLLITSFRSALADWNAVPTGSMQPTIVEGDRILINKVAYDLRVPFTHHSLIKRSDPQRGDIIVFDSKVSGIRLVKRVIGVPGDIISMHNNRLQINNEAISYSNVEQHEAYADLLEQLPGGAHAIRVHQRSGYRASFAPLLIPAGYFLALGDNRDNSADSRVIGLIPRDEIIGRARSVVMSLDYDNYYLPRSERFLKAL